MDRIRNHFIHNLAKGRLLSDAALSKYARSVKTPLSLKKIRAVKMSWTPFAMRGVV